MVADRGTCPKCGDEIGDEPATLTRTEDGLLLVHDRCRRRKKVLA